MLQQVGVGVAITGSGSAMPTQVFTNDDLGQIVETSDDWIADRTGIRQRRLADPLLSLSSLATEAAKNALAMANIAPADVDLIILASSSPDDLFGSASKVQAELGANRAAAFDLTAACSGFVFGLVTAAQFICTGTYQTILLIGADVLSRWVDWRDRRTCILFGDGAGAVVLQANEHDRCLGFELRSDGSQNSSLTLAYEAQPKKLLDEISVSQGTYQPITMDGKEVYRFAVQRVPEVIEKALHRANLTTEQVDWLVLHQANQRILAAIAQRLKMPPEKVISNLANYGNTSAASIPLALDEAIREGKIQPGDTIAAAGFGAGLSWGAVVFQWGK